MVTSGATSSQEDWRYRNLMRPNKVETAVQWFCMSYAVFAGFSDRGNSVYKVDNYSVESLMEFCWWLFHRLNNAFEIYLFKHFCFVQVVSLNSIIIAFISFAKIILILEKYLFGGYSKWQQIRVLHHCTEVCHEIFSGWKVQIKWNLQKNLWCVWRSMFLQMS